MGLRDQINKINNPILSSKDSLDINEIALILNLINIQTIFRRKYWIIYFIDLIS
jgi:hypothetical protein